MTTTKTAYQLRSGAGAAEYVGKTIRFTVPDRHGRPGRDKTFEGELIKAWVVLASTGPACTAIRICGVDGAIWTDDHTVVQIMDRPGI